MGTTRRGWIGARAGRGRWRAVLLLVAVVLAVLGFPIDGDLTDMTGSQATAAPDQEADTASGPPDVLPADGSWTVTLLTGEVIEVWSDAEGRASASVRQHLGPMRSRRTPSGDLYITPIRVTPLLDQVLDIELFNVTGLVQQGYDDASSPAVPLIVVPTPGAEVQSTLSTADAGAEQPLPSIGAVATEVPKGDARATGDLLAELSGDVDARTESVGGISRI
jgi:hypothetical protein